MLNWAGHPADLGHILASLGLTLAGSKAQKGDELPRNGPQCLCEIFFSAQTFDWSSDILPAAYHKRTTHRAVAAVIRRLPPDWKRPSGRPIHTWLRAVEADLGQQNIGLASGWRKAAIRDDWRRIVDTETPQRSTLWKKKRRRPVVVYKWNFNRFLRKWAYINCVEGYRQVSK